MFKITSEEIELGDVIRAVEAGNAGAIVHFLGVVRNNTEGREVSYLEYEAYPPMAEKKMAEIAQEIHEKWGLGPCCHDSSRRTTGKSVRSVLRWPSPLRIAKRRLRHAIMR